jgi:hypothetical protein
VRQVASAPVLGMLGLFISIATDCSAAAIASGKNWRIAINSVACEGASLVVIGARIGYLGPKGLVEAPVSQLLDARGGRHPARSLVWKSGRRENARWLSTGGVADLRTGDVGEFQIRFDAQAAAGELKLEFGDIPAFSLTRKGASAATGLCEALLRPEHIQAPRASPAPGAGSWARTRIYREAYPCVSKQGALQTLEARHPPYLPRQLLVFGRGYLPGARYIDLPMGRAPAQSYRYIAIPVRTIWPRSSNTRGARPRIFPSTGTPGTSPSTGGCRPPRAATSSTRSASMT